MGLRSGKLLLTLVTDHATHPCDTVTLSEWLQLPYQSVSTIPRQCPLEVLEVSLETPHRFRAISIYLILAGSFGTQVLRSCPGGVRSTR